MMAINGAPVATSDNYNDAVHGFDDYDVDGDDDADDYTLWCWSTAVKG